MVKMSKEQLEGWKAARVQWQTTGSVPPYPPDMEVERIKQANEPLKKESVSKATVKGGQS